MIIAKKKAYLFFFLLIIFLLTFREFIDTLKFFFLHSYNSKIINIDPYYLIPIDWSNGDFNSIGWPWSTRYIPNFFYYIFYNFFPCLKLTEIPVKHEIYCSFYTIAFLNYSFLLMTVILNLIYCSKVLKRDNFENGLIVFTSFFILKFLDRFGVDQISIFFAFVFIFILKSHLSVRLIYIALMTFCNDKIILLILLYYFSQLIYSLINNKKFGNYAEFLFSIFSVITYLVFIFSFERLHKDPAVLIYTSNFDIIISRFLEFFTLSGLTGTIIPAFIIIFPVIISYYKKDLLSFNVNPSLIFLLVFYLIVGFFIGGYGNAGRYMIFCAPFTIFILNSNIANLIKKI